MIKIFSVLLLAFMIIPSAAHAYLDPGTGSMILQALAAGVVAVAIFWRNLVRAVKGFFWKKNPDTQPSSGKPDDFDSGREGD